MSNAQFITFSAQTRMSGVDVDERQIRKGAIDAVKAFTGTDLPLEIQKAVDSYFPFRRDPTAGRR